MEDNMGNFSAYDAVELLLLNLEIILQEYDCKLDWSIRRSVRTMYDKVSLMKSLLIDKKLTSSLESRIADKVDWVQSQIGSEFCSLMGIHIAEQYDFTTAEQYDFTTGIDGAGIEDGSSTVQNMVFRISKVLPFVVYDAVVLLLHDLKRSLSFYRHTFSDHSSHLTAGKQIMYDNLSMLDSLLIDSSGQCYDTKLMSGLDGLICFVAQKGLGCIDRPRPWSSILGPNVTAIQHDSAIMPDSILNPLTKSVEVIIEELRSIHDNREVIHKSTKELKRKSTDIEHQTSSGVDGAIESINSDFYLIARILELVNKKLRKIRDDRDVLQKSTRSLQDATSKSEGFTIVNKLHRTTNEGGKLVGFEQDLSTMLDLLTGYPQKLQVYAVVGMGGIGKTTFAKRLYDDPFVKYRFHIRAWFTISQQYQIKEVLIGLVRCLIDPVTEIYERSIEELKLEIYKSLKEKPYLIVLDDMWDEQVWDDLRKIFPDDKNGSRIMLTSRLKGVAMYASPCTPPHYLPRLSLDESWELFCSKIFVNELCPPELEPIGKQITCKCQGLPLAIVVIAGLLSKMKKTLEVWDETAKSVCSIVMDEPEQCRNILALSYNHLPDNLKSCFLYMGIFPEDFIILAKKLIWLWIGEGFIRPRKLESFEEVAENYLEDLVGRSLIQVNTRSGGRIKTCYVHDMLRDLCLRECNKQQFFHVYNSYTKSMEQIDKGFLRKFQRFCVHSIIHDSTTISSLSYAHSFLCFKTITSSDFKSYLFEDSRVLKVLDITAVCLEELREGKCRLPNLRYLALSFQKSIDRSIFTFLFHNIQILIIEGEWNGQLPRELWALSELQHFQLKRSFLSYWPEESRPNIVQLAPGAEFPQDFICSPEQYEKHSLKVLQNLQSLTTIRPISCTEQVFRSMPNLKKLGVYENEEDCQFRGWFKYLIHLKELQTLKYVFRDPFVPESLRPCRLPSMQIFLPRLMNLTLCGTSFPWEDMLKLYALPKLEVLKLKNHAFSGTTWTLEQEEAGFAHLKYLLIRTTNLQLWEADRTHFPCLQHLVIMNCRSPEKIPCDIFEAPQLKKIELDRCSESAATSAKWIQQEQSDNGYDGLTLHIT